jgi:outer membrane protein TolC
MNHFLVLTATTVILLASGCIKQHTPESLRTLNAKDDVNFSVESRYDKSSPKTKPETEVTVALPSLSGPITLDEAIAYALACNLNVAVSEAEKEVQREVETAAMMRMLPSLIVNAERSWKSRHVPSRSENYQTGVQSLAPSISSEKAVRRQSAELSWNLLDLAINVNLWKQAGDRSKIRSLQIQRIKQNLSLDVTGAYMRAVVAKDSAKQAKTIVGYAMKRQKIIDTQMERGHIAKIDGLQSGIDIAELLIRLTKYTDEYTASKTELARLMGIDPSTSFELAEMDFDAIPGPLLIKSDTLNQEAILNRPELFELDLDGTIAAKDAEIALLQMFPSLTPFVRYEHDSNKYLTRHDWFVSGLKLSWDLFSMPEAYAKEQSALAQSKLIKKRRMNMAMAVLTQLRLAMIEYENYQRQVEQTRELEDLREELTREVHMQVETGRLKESTLLNADQLYVIAHRARLIAYARLVTARQRILNSLGRDWDDNGQQITTIVTPDTEKQVAKRQ